MARVLIALAGHRVGEIAHRDEWWRWAVSSRERWNGIGDGPKDVTRDGGPKIVRAQVHEKRVEGVEVVFCAQLRFIARWIVRRAARGVTQHGMIGGAIPDQVSSDMKIDIPIRRGGDVGIGGW